MDWEKIITDEDFGLKSVEFVNPKIRTAARGVVVRADGKVAIINKVEENVFKLPGGGMDEGEDPIETFKREVLEEAGCEVEVLYKLGITQEHKSIGNFIQTSHVYVARVTKDLEHLNLTEKEQQEKTQLLWLAPQEGLQKIKDCIEQIKDSPCDKDENVYASKFIVTRDRYILEQYITIQQGK